jgi:uncharacterized protein YbcI
MTNNLPTRGQLERQISQKVQALYREQLGHQPSKVTCQIFDNKLALVIEQSITNAEQILLKQGKENLAEEVHSNLDDAIKSELKDLIREITKIEVIDVLSDATLETERTGTIVILESMPEVRNPESMSKLSKSKK